MRRGGSEKRGNGGKKEEKQDKKEEKGGKERESLVELERIRRPWSLIFDSVVKIMMG